MDSCAEFCYDEYGESDRETINDLGFRNIGSVENYKGCLPAGYRLINAILEGKLDEAKHLIKNGADVNYCMKGSGWTPLMCAASRGAMESVFLLLNNGADPNCHLEQRTALMCLCESTSFDEVQVLNCLDFLIEAGADVNATDLDRLTPLMMAVRSGHSQLIARLLSYEADLEIVSENGWTAVFFAVNSGNLEVVKMLKTAGCNLSLKDNNGQTLYDLASVNNFADIAEMVSGDECYNKKFYRRLLGLNNYEFVMSQLPDRNLSVFSGFYEETLQTIATVGLNHLIPLFMDKKIGYGQFLIFTEEDWKKVGVEFSSDRKRLVWYAYLVVKCSWNRGVILELEKDELNLFYVAQILLNNVRILYILKATLHVCIRELHNSENSMDSELINALNDCSIKLKLLTESLERLSYAVVRIADRDNIASVDLLSSNSYCKAFFKKFTFKFRIFAYAVTFFTFSFIIFKSFKLLK